MDDSEEIDTILLNFDEIVKNPDKFVSVQHEKAKKTEELIKRIYDFTKSVEERIAQRPDNKQNTLPSLILEHFDPEQIWGQLSLQNDEALGCIVPDVASLLAKKKLIFMTYENKKNVGIKKSSKVVEDDSESIDDTEVKHPKPVRKGKSSVVDDKFFKLSEMEDYVNKIEKGIEGGNEGSDDESVDLFENDSEDENDLRYNDFFDQPEDGIGVEENQIEDDDEERSISEKDENEEGENDFSDEDPEEQIKSSYEARQERLKARIAALEEEALKEKPWQLKGEVTASKRPQNSLLEEYVEFDVASRPAPIITEKSSLKLEDVIRQRIKDKVWDDVVRKIKPVEDPKEYKKKLILNQEKSKLSLSEIYEREYLKEKGDMEKGQKEVEEEESKDRVEIKKAMKILFSKLDALSNFHYTPKQSAPEVRITSHLPAIVAEEVAPVSASDATLLAPEEIKPKPKGDPIGKTERTTTDKKRERRKKITRQRSKRKEKEKQEKLVDKLQPGLGNKYSKEKAKVLLEKVSKEQNVSQMDQKYGKHVKSSDAFFSKLQDEVSSSIKRKTQNVTDFNKQKKFSAKKIKL